MLVYNMLTRKNTLQIKGGAIIMMIAYHLCGCPEIYNEMHPNRYGSPIRKPMVCSFVLEYCKMKVNFLSQKLFCN